jgi:hypothetical protein
MRAVWFFIGSLAMSPALAAGGYPIAGLTPGERPAGAPVMKEPVRGKGWDAAFFKGVDKPYPASLSWSRDQGSWYTPFNNPGMPGRYDIRGWHKAAKSR